MRQARRIVAAYVAGLLVSPEALGMADLPDEDSERLMRAGDEFKNEMLRRSGRKDMGTVTLKGLIADELAHAHN